MRRFLMPALMISLLLTGCGAGGAEERLKAQREKLSAAEEITFTADITADLGSEVFDCTLDCAWTPEELTVQVSAPESITGVCTRFRDGEAVLEFGDVSLGVGTAGEEGLSPVSAVPLLTDALRSGFLRRVWRERDGERELLAAEIYVTDAAALTMWFDAETLTPLHGEFYRDGRMILRCEIRDFTFR